MKTEITQQGALSTTKAATDDLDEILLTPDNIKNMRTPVSITRTKITKHSSIQDFILQHSPPKTSPLLKSESMGSLTSGPHNSPRKIFEESNSVAKTPSKSKLVDKNERFAGAAFSNSPAPSALPLPAFDPNQPIASSGVADHVQPTRLDFSPPTKDQSFNPSAHRQPKPILKNGGKNRNNNNTSPVKKYPQYHAKQSKPNQNENTSPSKNDANLDQLSNNLKMMLNICPVQS